MTGDSNKILTYKVCVDCGRKIKLVTKKRCGNCYKKYRESLLLTKECGCSPECKEMIPITYMNNKPRKYAIGHYPIGSKGYNYKGGRRKKGRYWQLLIPKYYSSHSDGYISEHIYNFQEYNKLCMLPWGNVHHIEPVTENYCNNMVWNLIGITKSQHMKIHHYEYNEDYYCSDSECKTPSKTYITEKGQKKWYNDGNGGHICENCYRRNKTRHKIKKCYHRD
jgi:hypothetical protein